ncbi:DUF2959 family protein [Geobacter sp. AOG2]|uniref:DUF2959 family protein n=1 Tax=Geobacter sp. AOG2 TaxID=1566347 RepID=UPI001CC4D2A4|nr:DUF2959 family protein [Geobacter sp. AOG2]GFE60659.1 hypothetical protein AOG2_12470 [Geobacter sp. AOG2]
MKFRFQSAVFFTTVLLGAFTSLTGCATTGMDRATKTTNSMQMVEGDYKHASVQIDATRASLEELVKPNQADMKKAFDAYTDNVQKMEKSGKQLDTHTEKMRVRGNEYFTEWESSYTNPEIRELSERRRIDIREGYVKISEASIGVKGALKSYLTDIREIQKYLANDLTPQGVDSIRPIAQRALTDGDNLKETVKPVLAAIDLVKVDMVQGGMNKEPATGGNRK